MKRHAFERNAGAFVVLVAGATCAFAHGGYYQGPKTPDGIPLPTTTPSGTPLPRGGPLTPPTFGPAVTGRKNAPPPAITPSTTSLPATFTDPGVSPHSWEKWWAVHRQRFLHADRVLATPLDTTPDEIRPSGPTDEVRAAAVAALVAATADTSADVRASAALALARSGARPAGAALRALALDDDAGDVRDVAVLSLGVLGETGALVPLQGLLASDDEPRERRALAAVAIGMCGGADAVDLLTMAFDTGSTRVTRLHPEYLAAGLVGLGAARRPEAIEPLRAALANVRLHAGVHAFAAEALGAVGDRGSIDTLVRLVVESPQVSVRQGAATALGNLLTAEDVRPVNALLHAARRDSDLGVRALAAVALGGIRDDAVRAQIAKDFGASSDAMRPWFALALGLQGDASAGVAVREAFAKDDHEESLQGAYSIALGLMGDGEARAVLVPEVARKLRYWSPGYAAQGLVLLEADDAADALFARLGAATDIRQRAAFATALGLLDDDRGAEAMLVVLDAKSSVFDACHAAISLGTQRSLSALPRLVQVASDPDRPALVRACAISAIGRVLDDSEVPALAKLLAPHGHLVPLDALVLAREMNEHR